MNYLIYFKNKDKSLPRESAKWRRSGGFTLIEFLVVISIAVAMMTAVVVQQGKWNDSLSVNTQTYEMVLMIRQAQVYSLGVNQNINGSGDTFDVGYGISIDSDNPNQYVFFVDQNKNKIYDSGEEKEIKTFTRNLAIEKVCGIKNNSERCSPNDALRKISISFFRPDPKANIYFLKSNNGVVNNFDPPAKIYLKSPMGKVSIIKVESNGQVSILQ